MAKAQTDVLALGLLPDNLIKINMIETIKTAHELGFTQRHIMYMFLEKLVDICDPESYEDEDAGYRWIPELRKTPVES